MVKEITLYLEGGGTNAETLAPFRQGMSEFLAPLVYKARQQRVRWTIVPCGGRSQAYKAFKAGLKTEPSVHHVLLIDAEETVADRDDPWEHLKSRIGDEWTKPAKSSNDQCHLMIVTMETWFLADAEAITELFRKTKGFDATAFPAMPADPAPPKDGQAGPPKKPSNFLESKTKAAVNAILKKAFKDTVVGEYRKIDDGARMLAVIDPAKVRKQCPSCDRLFETLGKLLDNEKV
jgi:Domain of unknown function (DUF4276)